MGIINGFHKYLVFYLPIDGGIMIIRVIHGAQDIESILGRDVYIHGVANRAWSVTIKAWR